MFRKLALFALLTLAAVSVLASAHPISAQASTVTLNDTVNLVQTDIQASNGVIHIIDGVLVPPPPGTPGTSATATVAAPTPAPIVTPRRGGGEDGGDSGSDENTEGGGNGGGEGEGGGVAGTPSPSIAEVIAANPDLTTLASALKAAGLTTELTSQQSIYTVFAPTNEAFDAYLKAQNMTLNALLADKTALTKILTYHVVDKVLLSIDLSHLTSVTTLNGADIAVSQNMALPEATVDATPTAIG